MRTIAIYLGATIFIAACVGFAWSQDTADPIDECEVCAWMFDPSCPASWGSCLECTTAGATRLTTCNNCCSTACGGKAQLACHRTCASNHDDWIRDCCGNACEL